MSSRRFSWRPRDIESLELVAPTRVSFKQLHARFARALSQGQGLPGVEQLECEVAGSPQASSVRQGVAAERSCGDPLRVQAARPDPTHVD
jgi:hypothetical protein